MNNSFSRAQSCEGGSCLFGLSIPSGRLREIQTSGVSDLQTGQNSNGNRLLNDRCEVFECRKQMDPLCLLFAVLLFHELVVWRLVPAIGGSRLLHTK